MIKPEYIPLLRKGVEWVEEQEKLDFAAREWVQEAWVVDESIRVQSHGHKQSCGTGRCLAGYLGYQLAPNIFESEWVTPDGTPVPDYVENVMGIGADEGCELWDGKNKAADIRAIAESIAGERL